MSEAQNSGVILYPEISLSISCSWVIFSNLCPKVEIRITFKSEGLNIRITYFGNSKFVRLIGLGLNSNCSGSTPQAPEGCRLAKGNSHVNGI
jgi:hypothetical protein